MLKTSECVSIGHPDKVADYIASYILNEYHKEDKNVRCGIEVQIKGNYVTVSGEVASAKQISINEDDIRRFVKEAVANIGYTDDYQQKWGVTNTIGVRDLDITTHIFCQSTDISQGVVSSNNEVIGFGDQGIFFGFAVDDPDMNYMTSDYYYAKDLCNMLYALAKGGIGGLDIKTQVTTDDEDFITDVTVAIPVLNNDEYEIIKSKVYEYVKDKNESKSNKKFDKDIQVKNLMSVAGVDGGMCATDLQSNVWSNISVNIIINGTGSYVMHGPIADCGTTGRKLVVDFYGSGSRIGGGCPWGKDATKADLLLNMFAREYALQSLYSFERESAYRCEVGVSCSIGKSDVIIATNIYNKDGECIYKTTVRSVLHIKDLIERYNLYKSNAYIDLCERGLFINI